MHRVFTGRRSSRRRSPLWILSILTLVLGLSSASALPTAAQSSPDNSGGDAIEADSGSEVVQQEQFDEQGRGGGKNNVVVHNHTDGKLLMRGSVDLEHIPGSRAAPVNYAEAVGSCVNCQTLAVALQIALISREATTIAPQNAAVALNNHCTGCFTSARALQYVIQVDDPNAVPDRASELVQTMNRELRAIQHSRGVTAAAAQARIDTVVTQFGDLAASLKDERKDTQDEHSPGADELGMAPVPQLSPE